MPRLLLTAFMWVLAVAPLARAEANGVLLDPPVPVVEFSLHDHRGQPFDKEKLKGRWSLVLIGYTSCPDVCPFTLANLQAVVEQASLRMMPGDVPGIIFLAVDPERDAPVLGNYVHQFGPGLVGITGGRTEIDKLVESLDGSYRLKKHKPGDVSYEVRHSAAVAVISPRAEVVAKINPPFSPGETGEFLAATMRRFKRKDSQ